MKKIILVGLVTILLLLAVTGCKGNDLIGTWIFTEESYTIELVFKSGNRGRVVAGEIDAEMIWIVEDDKLEVIMNNNGENQIIFENADYSVADDKLTVINNGETYVLNKKK